MVPAFVVLRDFATGIASEQGAVPKSLCAAPDGAVYGLVRQQGTGGAGVFRFRPNDGSFVWLHTFDSSNLADYGTILSGNDGLLYGTIDTVGTKIERVFRLDSSGGNFALLRTLTSNTSSGIGTPALTEGPNNLLYGVTMRNSSSTLPLLFSLSRDGSVFAPLHDVTAGYSIPMLLLQSPCSLPATVSFMVMPPMRFSAAMRTAPVSKPSTLFPAPRSASASLKDSTAKFMVRFLSADRFSVAPFFE